MLNLGLIVMIIIMMIIIIIVFIITDLHEKQVSMCNDQREVIWSASLHSWCSQNCSAAIFVDSLKIIRVKLCIMVVLTELNLLIPTPASFLLLMASGAAGPYLLLTASGLQAPTPAPICC